MAVLASSQVSLYPTNGNGDFYLGSRGRELIGRRVKLVLTGQGGQTNTIGAAALGFENLYFCGMFFDDTNNVGYPAAVDPVTNTINLFDGVPTDVTATGYITVIGSPLLAA